MPEFKPGSEGDNWISDPFMGNHDGGHDTYLIEYDDGRQEWRFIDNNEVAETGDYRPCNACKMKRDDGPDPCIGYLPGVNFACCGHGKEMDYISFENGVAVYFDTLDYVYDTNKHEVNVRIT